MAFSPDGHWLATASLSDKNARIWDASSGQQRYTLLHDDSLASVAFSPDGRWLAIGTCWNQAVLWKLTPL